MTMLVAWTAVGVVGWYSTRTAAAALSRQLQPMDARDLGAIAGTAGRLLDESRDWTPVQRELERVAVETGKQVAIFDSTGRAVAASSDALTRLNLRFSGSALLTWQDTLHTTGNGGQRTTVARLHRVIMTGAPASVVRGRGGVAVGTAVALPPSIELDGPQAELASLRRSLVIGVIVAALGALVAATLLAAPIVRPIERLTAAANAIARRGVAGAGRTRIPVSGSGEVAELGHAFNVMVAALGDHEDMRRVMTSDIAHELRTPLTNIRCQIEALQDGIVPPDAAALALLHGDAIVLQRLIGDLQDLTLAEQKRLRLTLAVQNAWEELSAAAATFRQPAAVAGVELRVAPPETSSFVLADRVRLRQVLGNLVSNALRHAPSGTAIALAAERCHDEVVFSVRDSGPGIGVEHQTRIFERFYRVDDARTRVRGGAGLGLAIVKELVTLHGGRVWLDSVPGHGARFSIALPLHHA
jgi:signal transduction histidine kinase